MTQPEPRPAPAVYTVLSQMVRGALDRYDASGDADHLYEARRALGVLWGLVDDDRNQGAVR